MIHGDGENADSIIIAVYPGAPADQSRLGRRPSGAVLHSSNNPRELSQWLYSDDNIINIAVSVMMLHAITVLVASLLQHRLAAGVATQLTTCELKTELSSRAYHHYHTRNCFSLLPPVGTCPCHAPLYLNDDGSCNLQKFEELARLGLLEDFLELHNPELPPLPRIHPLPSPNLSSTFFHSPPFISSILSFHTLLLLLPFPCPFLPYTILPLPLSIPGIHSIIQLGVWRAQFRRVFCRTNC